MSWNIIMVRDTEFLKDLLFAYYENPKYKRTQDAERAFQNDFKYTSEELLDDTPENRLKVLDMVRKDAIKADIKGQDTKLMETEGIILVERHDGSYLKLRPSKTLKSYTKERRSEAARKAYLKRAKKPHLYRKDLAKKTIELSKSKEPEPEPTGKGTPEPKESEPEPKGKGTPESKEPESEPKIEIKLIDDEKVNIIINGISHNRIYGTNLKVDASLYENKDVMEMLRNHEEIVLFESDDGGLYLEKPGFDPAYYEEEAEPEGEEEAEPEGEGEDEPEAEPEGEEEAEPEDEPEGEEEDEPEDEPEGEDEAEPEGEEEAEPEAEPEDEPEGEEEDEPEGEPEDEPEGEDEAEPEGEEEAEPEAEPEDEPEGEEEAEPEGEPEDEPEGEGEAEPEDEGETKVEPIDKDIQNEIDSLNDELFKIDKTPPKKDTLDDILDSVHKNAKPQVKKEEDNVDYEAQMDDSYDIESLFDDEEPEAAAEEPEAAEAEEPEAAEAEEPEAAEAEEPEAAAAEEPEAAAAEEPEAAEAEEPEAAAAEEPEEAAALEGDAEYYEKQSSVGKPEYYQKVMDDGKIKYQRVYLDDDIDIDMAIEEEGDDIEYLPEDQVEQLNRVTNEDIIQELNDLKMDESIM